MRESACSKSFWKPTSAGQSRKADDPRPEIWRACQTPVTAVGQHGRGCGRPELVGSDQREGRAAPLVRESTPIGEFSVKPIAEGLISRTKDELPLDEPVVAARMYLTHAARGSSRICQVDSSTRLGTDNRGLQIQNECYTETAGPAKFVTFQ
jgi:hypothetical protein